MRKVLFSCIQWTCICTLVSFLLIYFFFDGQYKRKQGSIKVDPNVEYTIDFDFKSNTKEDGPGGITKLPSIPELEQELNGVLHSINEEHIKVNDADTMAVNLDDAWQTCDQEKIQLERQLNKAYHSLSPVVKSATADILNQINQTQRNQTLAMDPKETGEGERGGQLLPDVVLQGLQQSASYPFWCAKKALSFLDQCPPSHFNYEKYFEFRGCGRVPLNEALIFHTYFASNQWDQFHRLFIDSFLMTQNLTSSHLIIWTQHPIDMNTISSENQRYFQIPKYITIKYFDPMVEFNGTCLMRKNEFWNTTLQIQQNIKSQSIHDIIRIGILYKYGGIWINSNHFFLKSFLPLLEYTGPSVGFLDSVTFGSISDRESNLIHDHTKGFLYAGPQPKSTLTLRLIQSVCKFPYSSPQQQQRQQHHHHSRKNSNPVGFQQDPMDIWSLGVIQWCLENNCGLNEIPASLIDPEKSCPGSNPTRQNRWNVCRSIDQSNDAKKNTDDDNNDDTDVGTMLTINNINTKSNGCLRINSKELQASFIYRHRGVRHPHSGCDQPEENSLLKLIQCQLNEFIKESSITGVFTPSTSPIPFI